MSPTTGQIPTRYSPVRHSSPESKLSALPFDLHVLSIPPAFNLSQDQTLQFKFDSYLWQPIFLTRNSIELTLESLVDLWSHQSQRSTHTNYLSDLLKSFRTFRPGKTAYFTDLQSGVKNFFLDPDQRRSDLVWRRVFYRAKVVCQPLFFSPEKRASRLLRGPTQPPFAP